MFIDVHMCGVCVCGILDTKSWFCGSSSQESDRL